MDKTRDDLQFARKIRDFGLGENWRVVVYGGYGLDLALGRITRHHSDLDLVIYGQADRTTARKLLTNFIYRQAKGAVITIKREEFNLEFKVKFTRFSGDFYYTQTKRSPFADLLQVIKANGEIITNMPSRFPDPVMSKPGDLEIEVQDQKAHLADILYKKGSNLAPSKHDQDIENLKTYLATK